MRRDARRQFENRVERWLGFCCALVFLLIATHVFLMMSERHTAVMGPQMGMAPLGAIARLLPQVDDHTGFGHDNSPTSPHHTALGDCPAQQVVPPLLLLLLLLVALLRRVLPTFRDTACLSPVRPYPLSLPPPLDPARRRALLQVFLN